MSTILLSLAFAMTGPESGPAKGVAVPPLKVVAVRENLAAAENVADERKDQPTIYVFITKEKWERPTARFLRTLDEEIGKVAKGKLIAVWIADASTEDSADYLRKVEKSLRLARTLWTVHKGAVGDLEGWEINPDAAATAVLADGGKVVKSLGYLQTSEDDAKELIKKLTGK